MIEKNPAASRPNAEGSRLSIPAGGEAGAWAAKLLRSLGRDSEPETLQATSVDPALAWAHSGAMTLCGAAGSAPRLAPAPLASRADGALEALRALADRPARLELDAASLLGERAAIFGLSRNGQTSPSGSCKLLRTRDAWLAVNLARDEDQRMLPAWLGVDALAEPWDGVASSLEAWQASDALARARLLSLPVAPVAPRPSAQVPWLRVDTQGPPAAGPPTRPALVLDLSSLWAGPLCTHLLSLAGARVIKLESVHRPDGARSGPADFFDLLNGGKQSVALDLHEQSDLRRLRALIAEADIVVESARPRALAQLGIDASAIVRSQPGLTWLAISGYGRQEPNGHWVAFGDDASAAAGLVAATGDEDAPLFCGDAIADPLTGLHAAVAALAYWQRGGGALLDVSLRDVVACVLAASTEGPAEAATVRRRGDGWEVEAGGERADVCAPRARAAEQPARALGADTRSVLRELGAC